MAAARIPIEELRRAKDAVIVDVREKTEVKDGGIPGAIHIPMGKLQSRMADLPKNRHVVFY